MRIKKHTIRTSPLRGWGAILLLLLLCLPVGAKSRKQLVILHTNDTHSCILPMNPNLADTAVAGRGGYLRRVALIREERKKNPNLIYIDSGDFSQGSSYYTMFKGDVEVGLMNMMGLDVTTIGNHEWDFGLENLARLARRATFPIVCSNYDFAGTELDGLIRPYAIIKRAGVKVGVYAVCPKLEGLVTAKNYQPVRYLDPVECSNNMAKMLREKEKCDVVVCVSHLGWDERGDVQLIKKSQNIDVLLGGHSHSYFTELKYVTDIDGHQVPVNQNGKSGIYVGKVTIDLEKK